ncbi:hypothetical protein FQR65_LT02520 [Abscondita terminalis]|nr:hypothetical protein FQR65_LT02520 [Abscondita terminalis]
MYMLRHSKDTIIIKKPAQISEMFQAFWFSSEEKPLSARMQEFRKKLKEKPEFTKIQQTEESLEKEPLTPWPDNTNPYTGEIGGPKGPEPTRYGDWERKGRVSDF